MHSDLRDGAGTLAKASAQQRATCHFKTEHGKYFCQIVGKDKKALVQLTLNIMPEPAAFAASEVLLHHAAMGWGKPELKELKENMINIRGELISDPPTAKDFMSAL